MRAQLRQRLAAIHDESGRKVSLVGWSLGGIYARDLALHMPDLVRIRHHAGKPVYRRHHRHQRQADL